MDERRWQAWVVTAAGEDSEMVFAAPVEIPGWDEQPWVKLRPLTVREKLRRDSLGVRDEYEIRADGQVVALRRTYDFEAMLELDLECCIVDYLLPVPGPDGEVRELRAGEAQGRACGDLLDAAPVAVAEWLVDCIEAINMRRPADVALTGETKKGC